MKTPDGRNLARAWAQLCCFAGILAYVVALAGFFWVGKWIVGDQGRPLHLDFAWMYTAGRLALSDNPAAVYDIATFSAAKAQLTHSAPFPGIYPPRWGYPPTLLFAAMPLSELPYLAAFLVWVIATTSFYLIVLYAILPSPLTLLASLASPAVFYNVYAGQNGCLTAGLRDFRW